MSTLCFALVNRFFEATVRNVQLCGFALLDSFGIGSLDLVM